MNERQLDELKLTGALPSPTGVGLAILKLTQGDDYSMGDITRVIQSDPALTGRIIKLANHANVAGALPVATVAQAAMRLGVRSVRNVALGFTLVSGNRSGACVSFDYATYWARSLAIAVTAQALAELLRGVSPADAFTCGLLSDIGSMALASIHPERYTHMLHRARVEGTRDLFQLEHDVFDLDHSELAGAMLHDWKLPESLCYAVSAFERRDAVTDAPDEQARAMTRILRAAVRLVEVLSETSARAAEAFHDERIATLIAGRSIELARLEELRQQVATEWREWCASLSVPASVTSRAEALAASIGSAPAEQARDDKTAATAVERKGLRILAVDDDALSLRLLEHHLTQDSHHVVRAANGRQALVTALEANPQMVVTDWTMPEMDGIELCKSLRRTNEGRGMYILILTGREDEDRVVEAFDAGADEYVVKPFNPKVLLARVRAGQRMVELREQVERDALARNQQVAEMAVLNRKLETAAMTDVLTRLPNRRFAIRKLDEELTAARAARTPLSVMMIDIDHFKIVNDRWGHDMGDLVLRETASVLRATTRKGDVVCRLGGEEFLVISPRSVVRECAKAAERIRSAVEEHIIGFGYDRHVTVSLGVASTECGPKNVDELLKLADLRVYAAKALGRNQVCFEDPPQSTAKSA
jgi:diguanylate cyclase (GGDEF)-like protein